jgi:hypothetical protein
MANATAPNAFKRAANGFVALALAASWLAVYWPVVKVFDLSRADLMYQGVWIGDHARQITAVTPGGVADRAGLRVGDVLEFDPNRDVDWVLAGYRNMPENFRGSLPVRHADGSREIVTLVPERVAYLPSLNDHLALVARFAALTILTLTGVVVIWARPSVMAWSFLVASFSGYPNFIYTSYFLAFVAGIRFSPLSLITGLTLFFIIAFIPFAANFPRDTWAGLAWWKRAVGVAVALAWLTYQIAAGHVVPFERVQIARAPVVVSLGGVVLITLTTIILLARNYRRSDGQVRARLKWAALGICIAYANYIFFAVAFVLPFALSSPLSASQITPGSWVFALTSVIFSACFGYVVLRERVVDVQFAVSRTVVFGVVSTLALVFIATVHWLLGRLLEQSRLAIGLEGIAAIGLGLVLHRASRGINLLVDRVLFRKHHQAEERLRRATAALPYATDERSIAEAVVTEPVRNLDLASAALFYRDSAEGPLHRVLSHGWGESHAASLDADSLLVRYLQAEHEALKLDDPHLLPASIPDGAARPVLAIPVVTQHDLTALVLYGSHGNHTLLDPDEVELLQALAKAAATAHQHVRIAALERRNDQLEASAAELRALVQARMVSHGSVGASGSPA